MLFFRASATKIMQLLLLTSDAGPGKFAVGCNRPDNGGIDSGGCKDGTNGGNDSIISGNIWENMHNVYSLCSSLNRE